MDQIMTTIPYMSPEQIEQHKAAEHARVIGEIKYQMCFGMLTRLYEKGKITQCEFDSIHAKLTAKYRPQDSFIS